MSLYQVLKPPGIENKASSCYINSVLQCLMATQSYYQLIKHVAENHSKAKCQMCASGPCLLSALQLFYEEYKYQESSKSLSSDAMVVSLQGLSSTSNPFIPGTYQDAHEYFVKVMDKICTMFLQQVDFTNRYVEELKFELTQTVFCSTCNNKSITSEVTYTLELAVKESSNIQDLLTSISENEFLTDFKCLSCGIVGQSYKSSTITNHGHVICLHITKEPKRNTAVEIQESCLKVAGRIYRLMAIVNYMEPNHYCCYVKSQKSKTQWFYINDSTVVPVSFLTVTQQNPYMLFYQRDDTCTSIDQPVYKFSLPLSQLSCLWKCGFLTDQVILSYMNIIAKEAQNVFGCQIYVLNSQFYAVLERKGFTAVKRYFPTVNLLQKRFVLCFINQSQGHWILLVIDVANKLVEGFDSYKQCLQSYWEKLKIFLESRCHDNYIPAPDWKEWRYIDREDHPGQSNAYDCGVFVTQYALYNIFKWKWNFSQKNMAIIRMILAEEILCGELMDCNMRQFLLESPVQVVQKYFEHKCMQSFLPLSPVACQLFIQPPIASKSSTQPPIATKSSTQLPIASKSSTQLPIASKSSTQLPIASKSATQLPIASKSATQLLIASKPFTPPQFASQPSRSIQTPIAHIQSPKKKSKQSKPCKQAMKNAIHCIGSKCCFTCSRLDQLKKHLTSEHHIKLVETVMQFKSHEDFIEWKSKYEDESNSSFIKATGIKGSIQYYYCNRSGYFNTRGKGLRALKSQGSNKLDSYCTASITTKSDNGEIMAKVCHTHYGHEIQLGKIPLSKTTRQDLAIKLLNGVTAESILDKIRDSIGQELKRIHLLTKQDLRNVERSFGIHTVERDSDDATSVAAWVAEMKQNLHLNPVLLYKAQGAMQPDCCDDLSDDDFIIVLQTPLQAEILKVFGNGNVVCIDSTFGTNGYDFTLVTVMVIDEFGEGYPVAWCLSNREDQFLLHNFFKAIRTKTGQIQAKWLMTDDADQFYNAWVAIFGPTKKLLCQWHVDRAWRGALNRISDKNVQQTVYHSIRLILDETDVETFEDLLDKILNQLQSAASTNAFYNYFSKEYATRKEQWAKCYHIKAGINTNMHLEAFHHVLKYVYMKGKVNKRVDRCIHTLLRLARDKAFDRLTKMEKGKTTAKISDIHRRHRSSLLIPFTSFTQVSSNEWHVQSQTVSTIIYKVIIEQNKCCINCHLECRYCKICVHSYSCTCQDFLVLNTICKHIHLVVRSSNDTLGHCPNTSAQPVPLPEASIQPTEEHLIKSHDVLLFMNSQQDLATISSNAKVDTILTSLVGTFANCSQEALRAIEKHISAIIGLRDADLKKRDEMKEECFPAASNEPANKKMSKQKPFTSTRKRNRTPSIRIGKPDHTNKQEIIVSLQSGRPMYMPQAELIRLLTFFCSKKTAEKVVIEKLTVNVKDLKDLSDLPDEIVDELDIDKVEKFFDKTSWNNIIIEVKEKKKSWTCHICHNSTTKLNMIACDKCDFWFHWDCVGIRDTPKKDWYCSQCF